MDLLAAHLQFQAVGVQVGDQLARLHIVAVTHIDAAQRTAAEAELEGILARIDEHAADRHLVFDHAGLGGDHAVGDLGGGEQRRRQNPLFLGQQETAGENRSRGDCRAATDGATRARQPRSVAVPGKCHGRGGAPEYGSRQPAQWQPASPATPARSPMRAAASAATARAQTRRGRGAGRAPPRACDSHTAHHPNTARTPATGVYTMVPKNRGVMLPMNW